MSPGHTGKFSLTRKTCQGKFARVYGALLGPVHHRAITRTRRLKGRIFRRRKFTIYPTDEFRASRIPTKPSRGLPDKGSSRQGKYIFPTTGSAPVAVWCGTHHSCGCGGVETYVTASGCRTCQVLASSPQVHISYSTHLNLSTILYVFLHTSMAHTVTP